jgi:hypothetical protein
MGRNLGLGDANTPNQGYELYLTSLVMVLVAGLFVLGRLAARWTKRQFGMDDYTIILSLVGVEDRAIAQTGKSPANDLFRPSPSLFLSVSTWVRSCSPHQV